jgi:hypothetical protein
LHALCHHWHIALWVEYVPTGANPADELSRVGSSPHVTAPTRLMMPAWSVTSSCEPVSALRSNAVLPFCAYEGAPTGCVSGRSCGGASSGRDSRGSPGDVLWVAVTPRRAS